MEALDTFYEKLHWRYATKKFDLTFKLSREQIDRLLEGARLSASSSGLQPWKFVVVTDPAVREHLKAVSYGQSQITDASALIVFSTIDTLDEAYVDRYVSDVAKTRGVTVESLAPFKQSLLGTAAKAQGEMGQQWKTHQLYISLGFFLTTCAVAGIDACPMEGFQPAKYDEILKLHEKGVSARVICTIGKRSDTDKYASAKKVRKCLEEITIRI